MSSEIAIKVENLSKCYQIYDQPHDRLKQSIYPKLQQFAGIQPKQYFREFWALKKVSFEVKRGEVVGIIGRNGSGKSSLLQIICGTLNPTTGYVRANGRIAALLELGSGFNPEFTGRENVYMNAAVLGLSQKETDDRIIDIMAFSEIGEFIDQPVKTYSSGMMIRLAFSVAINVDPEILIVDEALAVGDESFQRKCFSRIESIRAKGATILFVSHAASQIVELCDRAVLMDAGENIAFGQPKKIVGLYQKLLYTPADKRHCVRQQILHAGAAVNLDSIIINSSSDVPHDVSTEGADLVESFDPNLKPSSTIEYESHGARIEEPAIYDLKGNVVNNLVRGRKYRYIYKVNFDRSVNNVRFGMLIKTVSGMELGGGSSATQLKDGIPYVDAGSVYRVEFNFTCSLNMGTYFLNAGVMGDVGGEDGFLHRMIDVAMFKVLPNNSGHGTGVVDFACVPEFEEVNAIA